MQSEGSQTHKAKSCVIPLLQSGILMRHIHGDSKARGSDQGIGEEQGMVLEFSREKFWRWMVVVMQAQHCTYHCLKMVPVVNFMLCRFYHNLSPIPLPMDSEWGCVRNSRHGTDLRYGVFLELKCSFYLMANGAAWGKGLGLRESPGGPLNGIWPSPSPAWSWPPRVRLGRFPWLVFQVGSG